MKKTNEILKTYILGFVLSLFLTFAAYFLVQMHVNSYHAFIPDTMLMAIILVIALIQLFVQLIFFLHLGNEERPRWNGIFFITTFGAVIVIIVASIWIMNHLNYNMTPQQMLQYIQDQSSF